jgi:hypothetical protein
MAGLVPSSGPFMGPLPWFSRACSGLLGNPRKPDQRASALRLIRLSGRNCVG